MDDYTPYLPWIVMAVNGLIAGWLAGLLLGGGGLIRNIFVGIIGSFVGGALVQGGLAQGAVPRRLALGAPDPGLDRRRDPRRHPGAGYRRVSRQPQAEP